MTSNFLLIVSPGKKIWQHTSHFLNGKKKTSLPLIRLFFSLTHTLQHPFPEYAQGFNLSWTDPLAFHGPHPCSYAPWALLCWGWTARAMRSQVISQRHHNPLLRDIKMGWFPRHLWHWESPASVQGWEGPGVPPARARQWGDTALVFPRVCACRERWQQDLGRRWRLNAFPVGSPSGLGAPGQQLMALPSSDRRKDVSHCLVHPLVVITGQTDRINEERGLNAYKEVMKQVCNF